MAEVDVIMFEAPSGVFAKPTETTSVLGKQDANIIEVAIQGPIGPIGPKGEVGPVGPVYQGDDLPDLTLIFENQLI